MSEWQTVKLGDITTKIGSGATPRGGKESYKTQGIALIRSLNIYDFYFDYDGLAFIDDDQANQLDNVVVESKDILLNITGASVARCCMAPDDVLPARVNQHVAIIRINPQFADPEYVYYTINSPTYKHHLLTLAQGGATREALTKSTIEDFKIPLPPLPTQRRIAAILSAYDDLIENNTRRIKALEQAAHDLYREWFVEFRFPGHESVPLVDSGTEYGMIPHGWGVVKLEEVIELAYGKALKADDRITGDFPVYGSSGIVGFHNEYLVEAPGIIVGRKGNVGSVFWATKNFYPIDTVYYVNTNLSLHYVYFNLNCQNFINNDAAVPGLSRRQAYSLPVVVPSAEALNDFDEYIEPIFEEVSILTEKNNALREARDLLLLRLVSGQLDVSDIELELHS